MKRIPPEPLIQARHSLQGISRYAIQRSCHAELFHWKTPTLLRCQHFSHAWESWRGLNCWESEIWWGDRSRGKWSSRCNSRPKWWWWWCPRTISRICWWGGFSEGPFEEGLEPTSPELSPCSSPTNRPSPAELLGSSSKPQHSSALARSLPPRISDPELLSQPTLISSPISTGTLFAHTVFQTKQQDTGKIRICLASDIRAPHSDTITLNPSQVDVERYCGLLKSEWILDQEGRTNLVFHPAGGEQIPIFNRMMFHAAVTYQVDRKADMVTFSEAVRRDGWFRFWWACGNA